MTQKAIKLFKIDALLFVVAIAVSGYLVWHHYELVNGNAGFGSFCSISQTIDCDVVNTSQYSEVFGVPIATVAFSYYVLALILSLLGAFHAYWRREAALLLTGLSLGSLIATTLTLGIMLVRLKAFCLMCGSLDVLDILTCIISLLAARSLFRDADGNCAISREIGQSDKKRILAFLGIGALIFVAAYGGSSQLEDKTPFDQEMFLTIFRAQNVQNVDPGNSPRQGFKGDAPMLRLVEFADFECPHCSLAAKQMHRLLKIYGDRVQLVFKSYPLDMACNTQIQRPMHQNSCMAARAAICAQQQGKFEELYEKMFSEQTQISRDNILAWAREFGMNIDAFNACLESPDTASAVLRDIDQANALGLQSTPTFFANGRKVEGVIDEARLKVILREIRK